jgi:hypothetical protein
MFSAEQRKTAVSRRVAGTIKLLLETGCVRIGEDEWRGVGDQQNPVNQIGGRLHRVIKAGHARHRELDVVAGVK